LRIQQSGLLTIVACQFGQEKARYALAGGVAITGALVQWLRDNLGLIEKSSGIEALARTVPDNGGVYFVSAFPGSVPSAKRTARARGRIPGHDDADSAGRRRNGQRSAEVLEGAGSGWLAITTGSALAVMAGVFTAIACGCAGVLMRFLAL